MSTLFSGGCACGAIRYECAAEPLSCLPTATVAIVSGPVGAPTPRFWLCPWLPLPSRKAPPSITG
jgi:hypothetical protein